MSSKKIICHYSVLLILQYLATGWPMVLCLSFGRTISLPSLSVSNKLRSRRLEMAGHCIKHPLPGDPRLLCSLIEIRRNDRLSAAQ